MSTKPVILVVDDDSVSLNLLQKLVEKLNYTVVTAVDGEKALEVLRAQAVDLVIADYDMPVLDGLELLKTVKAEFPRLPFIMVTAYSNLKVIAEAWANGAFDFFQKPVFVDRLHQTLRLAVEYGHLSIARRRFPKMEELVPDPDLLNIGVVRELAVALEREDLLRIVEEFETHARIELEQIFRFNVAKDPEAVRSISHRLAGTSINLGLIKLNEELREIEAHPEQPIRNPETVEGTLEHSIYWLKNYLTEIFQDLAV
ncbi:MAG TPA: response regulator [Bdellovibrionales bacterium]|nr:response regulator [Bdellovibrionales bacterium]